MSKDLKILEAYAGTSPVRIDRFNDGIQSSYTVESDYEKVEVDFEWLALMEDTVRYLDNILRNPNRFIVNEEEVVKVEQSRRVTVESIKHLAKHTNFIQKIEKNGDVQPSKVLNINKDESYNTYENRVIYTLIQNMRTYVDVKKSNLIKGSSLKDEKKCEYTGTSKVGAERVNINLVLNTKTATSESSGGIRDGIGLDDRIAKLELRITDLTNTPVYKALAKEHVARIIPPVKKTNLILKNVNFQYAMKLWDFLQSDNGAPTKNLKDKKVYQNDEKMKEMLDDVFLLNYVAVNSISVDKKIVKDERMTQAVEMLTDKMISKIVEINSDLPIEKIEEIIGDRIAIIKSKHEATLHEVEQKFNSRIQSRICKISNFDFRG